MLNPRLCLVLPVVLSIGLGSCARDQGSQQTAVAPSPELSVEEHGIDCPVRDGEVVVSTDLSVPPILVNREDLLRAIAEGYPAALHGTGISGATGVTLLIDRSGRVPEATVARSSGRPELDSTAVRAARRALFTGPVRGNETVCVRLGVMIPVSATTLDQPGHVTGEPDPVKPGDTFRGDLRGWTNGDTIVLGQCTVIVVADPNCGASVAMAADWVVDENPAVLWLWAGDAGRISEVVALHRHVESVSIVAERDGSVMTLGAIGIYATPTILAVDGDGIIASMRVGGGTPDRLCPNGH